MAHFVPSPGMENCPKCFGWQIRDLTKRNNKGWPLEAERIEDCDHCGGKGELPAKAGVQTGWGRGFVPSPLVVPTVQEPPKRRGRKPSFVPPPVVDDIPWGGNAGGPVKIEPDLTPVKQDSVSEGWANFNVDKPAEPAKGWAVFNKE